jgi:hypothetical protein
MNNSITEAHIVANAHKTTDINIAHDLTERFDTGADQGFGIGFTITATATGYEGGLEAKVYVPKLKTRLSQIDREDLAGALGCDMLAYSTAIMTNPQEMDSTSIKLLAAVTSRVEKIMAKADEKLDRARDFHDIQD